MNIRWVSEHVLIASKGKLYKAFLIEYDDGDCSIQVHSENNDEPPPYIYDLAEQHFTSCGYFDCDDKTDYGDNT